jgi:cellobiose phosphorylase
MTEYLTNYEKNMQRHLIRKGDIEFYFLPGGGLYEIRYGSMMLNQYSGTIFDYSPVNIYLRLFDADGNIIWTPLLGPHADSEIIASETSISARGAFNGLNYQADFIIGFQNEWFWKVSLTNETSSKLLTDLVYYQDVGLAERGGIKRNEYYTSQYIDHRVFNHKTAQSVIFSRQNEKCGNHNPVLLSGCIEGTEGFLTDGASFFGSESRLNGQPEALCKKEFDSKVYQGEFACHCIASSRLRLNPGEKNTRTFFTRFINDHPDTLGEKDINLVPDACSLPGSTPATALEFNKIKSIFNTAKYYNSNDLTQHEINKYYPSEKLHLESNRNGYLAFFTHEHKHVVLKNKELLVERPHGHMLRSAGDIYPQESVKSSCVWMNGVFASHISSGNISFNQCVSNVRSTWNLLPNGGLRIFIDNGSGWQLLGVPSVFEMDFNSSRWLYSNETNIIEITAMIEDNIKQNIIITAKVISGNPVHFLATVNLTMGGNEYDYEIPVQVTSNSISASPGVKSLMSQYLPDYTLEITGDKDATYGMDEQLYSDSIHRGHPLATILKNNSNNFELRISGNSGTPDCGNAAPQTGDIPFLERLFNNRNISGKNNGTSRIASIFPWFIHNALIHFSTPYGLEQYSGAAWGVRDICQGPVEMLISLGHPEVVRKILLTVFSHQYQHSGGWPQWFMFDRYYKIQQEESHGDVIIWPLKAVCEYIENTNDFSIMDAPLPYTTRDFGFSIEKEPLSLHIEKLLNNIKNSFVPGTHLIRYGGGDWNDSLQPLDHQAAEHLVSAWTVQLLYQMLIRFAKVCRKGNMPYEELEKLACGIKSDFNKYLVKDGITAGFALFDDNCTVERLLLHPSDKTTGIKHRLLPVNRGIISEIFTPRQAEEHIKMLKEFLLMPDGAHLMDTAPAYDGGKCHIFKRAETASYFGREISTNYIHAHLRYAEAMAKTGNAEELFQALLTANPVAIEQSVPNALPRQSNSYFSSSDGDFSDRYQAMRDFWKLREGKIKVKGGWRIYSSGPGIYVNLLITVLCGIRREYDTLVIDPVIAKSAGEITLDTEIAGRICSFVFRPEKQEHSPSEIKINGKKATYKYCSNPYRSGGAEFDLDYFAKQLNDTQTNIIEVTL